MQVLAQALAQAKVTRIGHLRMYRAEVLKYDDENPFPRQIVWDSAFPPPAAVSRPFSDALVAQLPALRRYAMALAGNAALADDLVQDCIERALGQEAQLRELPRMAGWLRRILYHLYIDEIRRGRRRGREQDIADLADHLELSAPAPDNSAVKEFIHAVNRLSVEHRQILLLVSVEELSYREIAEELDVPLGTVMSRLARARERLRELMENNTAEIISLPDRKKARE
jgi:RNA polymerase sigma-70 factor (ECF subfamily)